MLDNYEKFRMDIPDVGNDCYADREFWLIMDIIDTLHDVYNDVQGHYIKAEREQNETEKLHYFYKQGGVIDAESAVWNVLDKWREINEQ